MQSQGLIGPRVPYPRIHRGTRVRLGNVEYPKMLWDTQGSPAVVGNSGVPCGTWGSRGTPGYPGYLGYPRVPWGTPGSPVSTPASGVPWVPHRGHPQCFVFFPIASRLIKCSETRSTYPRCTHQDPGERLRGPFGESRWRSPISEAVVSSRIC